MARYLGDGECRTKLRDEPLLVLRLSYVFEIYHEKKKNGLKKIKVLKGKTTTGNFAGSKCYAKIPLGSS